MTIMSSRGAVGNHFSYFSVTAAFMDSSLLSIWIVVYLMAFI